MFKRIVDFIHTQFPYTDFIPLHEPCFVGKEKQYLLDCIESTFVSYVGEYVNRFERMVADYTKAKYAIATVNGTAALHIALLLAGVQKNDEVITQAVTFVATANAITYCGAFPIFLDSDFQTLGLSPVELEKFLENHCSTTADGFTHNKDTGRKISACIVTHVFGHPARVDKIRNICKRYNISLIEDAAESIGSFYRKKHTGTYAALGILSFNGNKTLTTGGGGMILCNNKKLALKAKHLTTTAKIDHEWLYFHDQIGFNYRMPNINAALGCAQMEMLPQLLIKKRELANIYKNFFDKLEINFITEPDESCSNYWLNAILLKDMAQRDEFLKYSNANGVMTRPLWTLLAKLPFYSHCQTGDLTNAQWLEDRLVNIPSSAALTKSNM